METSLSDITAALDNAGDIISAMAERLDENAQRRFVQWAEQIKHTADECEISIRNSFDPHILNYIN